MIMGLGYDLKSRGVSGTLPKVYDGAFVQKRIIIEKILYHKCLAVLLQRL